MMVETGGEGNDPMQSLGNSGLTEEEKTPWNLSRLRLHILPCCYEKRTR